MDAITVHTIWKFGSIVVLLDSLKMFELKCQAQYIQPVKTFPVHFL